MNPECHICRNKSEFLLNKDGFDEYLCPKCGLSFVHPQPTADWLKTEIYSLESGYQKNKSADLSLEPQNKRYGRVLNYMAKNKPKGKLLDVGCSSGQVMYWARLRGLEAKGVEINQRTADLARQNGFEVYNGFVEDAPFEKQSFDLIFLGDIIEHVNDPREFLKSVFSFLKPGGLMIISTPNVNCFWSKLTFTFYRLFKIPWTSMTPPYHLFQFSLENLNMLLAEFGFKPEKVFFLPPPSLKYELGSLHLLKRYKEDRSLKNFLYLLFSSGLYVAAYALNLGFHPFLQKDFQMSAVYSNPNRT